MLSSQEYIRMSMEFNLFWLRIMKEHAIFMEGGIPAIHKPLANRAAHFKLQFERLLGDAIRLANGAVSGTALQSGQYVTRYTDAAEQAVTRLTGVAINRNLTRLEFDIEPLGTGAAPPQKEQQVSAFNQSILTQLNAFIALNSELYENQKSCRLFTFLYTGDLEHMLSEARRFFSIVNDLQKRDERVNANFEDFWNHNMSDHAKSMRGLFDPTEARYFSEADRLARLFDALTGSMRTPTETLIADAKSISEFKASTTQGLLGCKIEALMSPLYTDHLLREANHYLYLLRT